MARIRTRRHAAPVSFRVPPLLLTVPLLGVAWLLPGYGFGLWLRLLAASLVLLLPGRPVARALSIRVKD